MIEAVQRLYQSLFQVLHILISPADLKWHCARYQVEDFNFFKFIRDCAGWNIAHVSLETNSLDHPALPFPILIKKKDHHDYHLLLAKDKAGNFKTYNSTKDLDIQLTLSDILRDYETWALLLEATIHVPQKRSRWLFNPVQNAWLIPASLLTAAGLFYSFQQLFISELVLFLLALIGIYLCWQLKIKPTSGKSSQWQEWCEKEDSKRSCDKVLKSDYSRLFNWIALADLGLAYFLYLGLFLILQKTVLGETNYPIWFSLINGLGLLIMLSLLAIQRFIIKNFCFLCLLVLGTITLINGIGFWGVKTQGWQSLDLIVISGVCAIAIVAYYSRAFYFFQISKRLGINHQNLLSTHEVFRSLLKANSATLPQSPYYFLINHQTDSQQIDVIISDTCPFCKKMLRELLDLLLMTDRYSLSIKIDTKEQNIQRLTNWLFQQLQAFQKEFNEYFNFSVIQKGEIAFEGPFSPTILDQIPAQLLQASLHNPYNIKKFPTTFLDGQLLPEVYGSDQLKQHLILQQYS